MAGSKPTKQPLLPLRTAVVLLCALIVSAVVGGLTYLGSRQLAGAILAGGTAFAGAVIWLDKIIA